MRRRRNPRADGLFWGYGVAALAELKAAGVDVPLAKIVRAQGLEDGGDGGVVVMAAPADEALVVAFLTPDGVRIVEQSDGMRELAELALDLNRSGKLPDKITKPLRKRLAQHKREARFYAKRAGARLKERGGVGSVEYEAVTRIDASDIAELLAEGLGLEAGWLE